jgi:Icc-related predicted phosphoesterase
MVRVLAVADELQRRTPGPVDVLLTHAPPRGLGDEDDRPHVGVDALHTVLERLAPRWHLRGHIHPDGQRRPDRTVCTTTIRNVIPYRLIEITPARAPALVGGPCAP